MTNETFTTQAEFEGRPFEKPSKFRKAVTGVLGGLGIFVLSNVYGATAGIHNDRIRDARAEKAREFDLNRAKITHVINLDENGEEIPEEGVPVAMNE